MFNVDVVKTDNMIIELSIIATIPHGTHTESVYTELATITIGRSSWKTLMMCIIDIVTDEEYKTCMNSQHFYIIHMITIYIIVVIKMKWHLVFRALWVEIL